MLICYDGSNEAKAAIDQAGTLLGGQPAKVLTVWQSLTDRTPLGFGFAPGVLNIEEADDASRMAAGCVAEAGAELARRRASAPSHEPYRTDNHRGSHPVRGGGRRGERDRDGLAWFDRAQVAAARERLARCCNAPTIVVPSPAVADSRKRRHAPSHRSR